MLYELVKMKIRLPATQVSSVVSSMYSFLSGLLINLWKPRCDDFAQAEQSRGITIKKKKSKYNRSYSDNVTNPEVTLNHSSRKHDSDLSQWTIWSNYVCQYGGTYQGFLDRS